MKNDNIQLIYIDLFAGAGGTTTGVEEAVIDGRKCARVIACVNHDALAIQSHASNHPSTLHFTEDIRTLDVAKLKAHLDIMRVKYPSATLVLWASLECTNFSKAKGGKPRDADSRTLADSLDRYIMMLDPDMIQIENVEEFMAWGDVDENGKPLEMKRGVDYIRWRDRLCGYGYHYDYRVLNSADFGAFTSRRRYFGQFARIGMPIAWPEATHAKNGLATDQESDQISLFGAPLKRWKPVREVLDLEDEGVSIFDRTPPLVEKTLERVYYGLVKFVAGGKEHFISKYFSGKPQGKNIPIDGPCGTIRTVDCQALVKAVFMTKYNSNTPTKASNPVDIEEPSPTISTQGRLAVVQAQFMQSYYGNGGSHSINEPAPTVSTHDRFAMVTADKWIMDTNFGNTGSSINEPARTITASHKHHYLMNPQYFTAGSSIENPCFTLIARMDKAPPYLVTTETGHAAIVIYETDSPYTIRIKEFMAAYGIMDIKMRMLRIVELKRITGFPENYILHGSQADQKKFIGNAVVTLVAKKIAEATAERVKTLRMAVNY